MLQKTAPPLRIVLFLLPAPSQSITRWSYSGHLMAHLFGGGSLDAKVDTVNGFCQIWKDKLPELLSWGFTDMPHWPRSDGYNLLILFFWYKRFQMTYYIPPPACHSYSWILNCSM